MLARHPRRRRQRVIREHAPYGQRRLRRRRELLRDEPARLRDLARRERVHRGRAPLRARLGRQSRKYHLLLCTGDLTTMPHGNVEGSAKPEATPHTNAFVRKASEAAQRSRERDAIRVAALPDIARVVCGLRWWVRPRAGFRARVVCDPLRGRAHPCAHRGAELAASSSQPKNVSPNGFVTSTLMGMSSRIRPPSGHAVSSKRRVCYTMPTAWRRTQNTAGCVPCRH